MKLRMMVISPKKKAHTSAAIGIGAVHIFVGLTPTYWVVLFLPLIRIWTRVITEFCGIPNDDKLPNEPKYKLANKLRSDGTKQPSLLIWHPEVVVYTGAPSVATHPAGL